MVVPKLIAFLRLLRFQNHHNFIAIILGALCFSEKLSKSLFIDLAFQYFTFGIALYGGIYVLNGLVDADQDRACQRKKYRPIPSGSISVGEAKVILIVLWSIAFLSSYIYEHSFRYFPIYLNFIAINLVYSCWLKKTIFRFLIGITCPMRLFLGAMIASASIPWTVYGISFFFMGAVQSLKIDFESPKSRTINTVCTVFCLLGSTVLWIRQYPENPSFLAIVAASHILFVVIPLIFPILAVYLFGADVVTDREMHLFLRMLLVFFRHRDFGGMLVFILMSVVAYLNRLLIVIEAFVWPAISEVKFEKVVFILGHQRSGTTYLHKSLHQLPGVHTSSLYDLWFASFILKIIGRPLLPLIDWFTRHWSTDNHPLTAREELEEYLWMTMRFKSIAIPYIFPVLMKDFSLLDHCLTYTDDDFLFFKQCLQRVLYANPSAQVYVGRPLALTIDYPSLRRHFPDTKVILCIRNPDEIMPSWVDHSANATKSSLDNVIFQRFMQYSYRQYSQRILHNMIYAFQQNHDDRNRLVYGVLFDRIKQDIRSEIESILAFIRLENDHGNSLTCSGDEICIDEVRPEKHRNRSKSHQIVTIDEGDFVQYQKLCDLTLNQKNQMFR